MKSWIIYWLGKIFGCKFRIWYRKIHQGEPNPYTWGLVKFINDTQKENARRIIKNL